MNPASNLEALSNVEDAWERVRANLRKTAGQRLFDQWLKPAVLVDATGDAVRIGLPSSFMTNWVRNQYGDRILHEFRAIIPAIRSVGIETVSATPVLRAVRPEPAEAEPAPVADALSSERPQFDPRFTFARFVVDSANRVAFNASMGLAEPGIAQYSPLYLHSSTGQGKTHLMHAIGRRYLEAAPSAKAIYMPAERFMFEFVKAVRERDTISFKARLRGVDLLMIDDLQFIAGKESTQEEFLHTVDEFMSSGKRLVIAADRCPQALEGIDSRLASRLGSGLVADIKPAPIELRRAILDRKLEDFPNAAIPEDVLELLAARISSNVRELEGALRRLVAYSQLNGEAITLDSTATILGDALRGPQRRPTIDEIQRAVSAHFDLKQLDLISARRAVAVARPRQIAMYLAKRLTTRSLPEIGRKFGNRDHTTVMYAVRRIEELRGTDHEIDGAVRTLMMQLEA